MAGPHTAGEHMAHAMQRAQGDDAQEVLLTQSRCPPMKRPPCYAPQLTLMVCTRRADLVSSLQRHVDSGTAIARCESVDAAAMLSEQLTVGGALVLDASDSSDDTELAALGAYRRRFPLLPTLALVANRSHTETLRRVGAMAGRIAPANTDDVAREIGLLIQSGRDSSPNGRIARMLNDVDNDLSRVSQDFLAFMSTSVRSVGTVRAAATQLHLSPRTIERHLRADGLPRTRVVFWTIVIYRALFVMQDPLCTLKRLARLLPFSSASAVTLRFVNYVGSRPGKLRKREPYWRMMEALDLNIERWTRGPRAAIRPDTSILADGPATTRQPVVAFRKGLSLQNSS